MLSVGEPTFNTPVPNQTFSTAFGVDIEALTLPRIPPKLSGIAALNDIVVPSLLNTITTSLLPFQVKLLVVNSVPPPSVKTLKFAVVALIPLN